MVTSKCRERTHLKTLVEWCNSIQFGLALQDVILFCRYRYKSHECPIRVTNVTRNYCSYLGNSFFFMNSDSTGESEIIPRTSSQDVGSIVVERKQNQIGQGENSKLEKWPSLIQQVHGSQVTWQTKWPFMPRNNSSRITEKVVFNKMGAVVKKFQ